MDNGQWTKSKTAVGPRSSVHGPWSKMGFTLVEIVLAVSLVGILFAAAGIVLRQGLDSYATVSERGSALQAARFAIERMTRELRRCGDDADDQIQNISASQISFTDADNINTSFNLNGDTLRRGTDTLLDNVSSLAFTGYKSDNTQTASAQQIRRVRIQMSVLPEGQTAPLTLRTDIFLRNYMYEKWQ